MLIKKYLFFFILFCAALKTQAQANLHDIDTTNGLGKNLLGVYKKFNHLKFSGYLQPQYQITDTAGAKNYSGGDFSATSNNRFMLRRGRLRLDYANYTSDGKPQVFFVFQTDGTERGVVTRDFWGRVFENKYECFALSAGIMARPFSFELLNSSSDRESPERGRVSQIHTRTERDLGAMITFEPRRKESKLKFLKWDLMIGNGQGVTGTAEFDSYKDFISRIYLKQQKLGKIKVTAAVSMLYGGLRQNSPLSYSMENQTMVAKNDSSNIGRRLPRQYYEADVQFKIANKKGFSELRIEYITGTQTATAKSNETPGSIPFESNGVVSPLYSRPFNAAIFTYLQHLGSAKHQAIIKYDWYDPNTQVKSREINQNFSVADIKFRTLGIGYIYYFNSNLRFVTYYEIIKNEVTNLKGYNRDLKDNVLTCRLHFRF